MATITWIGLGQMGRPMATNLVAAGHDVRGVEIDPQAAAEAGAAGIVMHASIASAVPGADFVFTMLPEGRHVESALTGPDGVFAHAGPDALVIDCSTIDVTESRELHAAAAAAGVRFLDSPVSGGIGGASAGTLTLMVGGEPETFAAAEPLLQGVGGHIVYMGTAGAGQATKIVNNMIFGICIAATCEGVELGERLGLDPAALYDVVTRSSGDNWVLRTWYPVAGVVDAAPSNRGFTPGFTAGLMAKDLGLALRAGEATGSTLATAAIASRLFTQHIADGAAQLDCTSLINTLRPPAREQNLTAVN